MNHIRFFLVGCCILFTFLSLTSCKRDGCTDPSAENYCKGCKNDDGTCTYNIAGSWSGTFSGCTPPATWLMTLTQTNNDVNGTLSCSGCGTRSVSVGGQIVGDELSLLVSDFMTAEFHATVYNNAFTGTYIVSAFPVCGLDTSGTWTGTKP